MADASQRERLADERLRLVASIVRAQLRIRAIDAALRAPTSAPPSSVVVPVVRADEDDEQLLAEARAVVAFLRRPSEPPPLPPAPTRPFDAPTRVVELLAPVAAPSGATGGPSSDSGADAHVPPRRRSRFDS